ncbi:Hypothetical predicted protein [Paramuricea clavata]|uniref:Uncharacterized protein n=1 Tax=Paramuricea clavata TaxID=317549 RepID=A0A7D9HQ71_PARCT|nr:Hypothetical predicted protein [Paramuricea clavata]
MPVKHKIIVSSNQHTLFQMFDKKIYDRENEVESESRELEKNTELDEITEMDDTEGDATNAINKTTSTEKECLDSEDFVSKKRNRRAESEPIPEKAVKKHFCSQSGENTGDASMIVELIKESNDRIEKKLDASEQKIIEILIEMILSTHARKQLERIETEHLAESKRQARSYTAGMNLFRIRYNEIMQGNSYNSFESDILTAKLNKCEVGDENHSRMFARALTKDIAAIMDIDLKQALSRKLDCTNQRPPVGMLEVPPVTHHDAAGLAAMAKKVLNGAGVKDSQLEGVGWDGQYVLLGVMEKLIELLDIPGMDTDTKRKWITQMWEPAHNIELATKDIREMTTVFDWFVEHISIVNGIIQTLNIGKGLEQCLTAAEEQNRRLYRLTNLTTTRFSAYFERSLSNFEKDFPVIVQALQTRSIESGEKDAREHASNSLKKILTRTFIMVNLGLIDIYRLLGSYSCLLQTVEQFPWTVEQ